MGNIDRRENYDKQNQDSCDSYDLYYEWLDGYNEDETQPPAIPDVSELMAEFSELGWSEAINVILGWMESLGRKEGGDCGKVG